MNLNKDIISRLKFIGKVKKGEKINVKFMYVQPDGLATQISRMLINQDNRGNTLSFLQETINRVFEIISGYERSRNPVDKIMCRNLIEDLKQSKTGLTNLKETYILDVKFCCDMDTLIQVIDTKLIEIEPIFTEEEEKEHED